MAPIPKAVEDRLIDNIILDNDGCWLWTLRPIWSGYGQIKIRGKKIGVHRVAYSTWVGVIPTGIQIDHRCHNESGWCRAANGCKHRRCINPAHLSLATPRENQCNTPNSITSRNRLKTRCPQGHPYDEMNTYVTPAGTRQCKKCNRNRAIQRTIRRLGRPPRPRVTDCCQRGHPFDEANTRYTVKGFRLCKACTNAGARRLRALRRATPIAPLAGTS